MGNPTYLVRQPCAWCFRMIIPSDLRLVFGKTELRRSLRTGSIRKAKIMARAMGGQIQLLFNQMRENGDAMAELSRQDILQLTDAHIQQVLDYCEEQRAQPNKLVTWNDIDALESVHYSDMADANEQLTACNYRYIRKTVDEFLDGAGIELDKESVSYGLLCREFLKARIRISQIEIQRMSGDYTDEFANPPLPHQQAIRPSPEINLPPEQEAVNLSEIITKWVAEKERTGSWTERTKNDFISCADVMVQALGNAPVASYTFKSMRDLKDLLLRLPPYFKTKKEYRDKSLQELASVQHANYLSNKAVNKYLGVAQGVFEYARKNNYILENPASGLLLPEGKRPDKQRDAFSNDDLNAIFHHPFYTEDTHDKAWKFWLPILGLYTGCRLEELCQLHVEDVRQQDGLWALDINSKGDKRTKTTTSERLILLHPFIWKELNFAGFVELVKKRDNKRIFHDLKPHQGKFGHYPSRWFGIFKKDKCGIVSSKKVFHSFRHNITDHLKQKGVRIDILDELTGHAIQGETAGRYGKRYNPQLLFEKAVALIDYGIELDHLKGSRWVPKS